MSSRPNILPVATVLLLAACAPALREPPALTDLAGPPPFPTADAGALQLEAERLWARRDLASVRRAAELFLSAAAVEPSRTETLIAASRTRVWLAGHEPGAAEREQAAIAAVQIAQLCVLRAPRHPACSYGLALALGVQARERRSTAMNALPKIVDLLEQVAESEPALDHGGPHRVLALVLARAPAWPSGPGDPERGLEQASRALAIDPDYPPNQLCMAELLAVDGDERGSRDHYARAARLARGLLQSGEIEAREWLEEAERGLSSAGGPNE